MPEGTLNGPAQSRDDARDLEGVEKAVAEELRPSPDLVERIRHARELIVHDAQEAARTLGLPLREALVAGSAARETYLPSSHDMDLFLLFDPSLPREQLEQAGLAIGFRILERTEKRYAEHPYVRGWYRGIPVDAVPGYRVERSDQPLTAVDRTPFHQIYLESRHTPSTRDSVRLLKQFLKALRIYGAEARTAGFSGYLVELLVLRYGSFREVLRAASSWRIPQDLEGGRFPTSVQKDTALILADPVDPNRNVASALSRMNLGLFILASQEYLAHPRREFFAMEEEEPVWTEAEAKRTWEQRRTTVTVLRLPAPDLVDDILYPQLRKAERGLSSLAEARGFEVLNTSSAVSEGRIAVLLETDRAELGEVRPQEGPPVGVPQTGSFLEKWTDPKRRVLQGPYVEAQGRLRIEVPRPPRHIREILQGSLEEIPLGRDLRSLLRPEVHFEDLSEVLGDPAVRKALRGLWSKRLPWLDWPRPARP